MRKIEIVEYFNDTGIDQLKYDYAKNPIIIHPGETRRYKAKIIYPKDEKTVIAIPKGR